MTSRPMAGLSTLRVDSCIMQGPSLSSLVLAVWLGLLLVGCDKNSNPVNVAPDPLATGNVSQVPREAGPDSQATSGEQAWALLQQGKTEQAFQLAQRVLIESPHDRVALQAVASVYEANGDFAEAAEIARELGKLNGDQGLGDWLTAFDWHLRASDVAAAEDDLRAAIRIASTDPRAHHAMAQLLNAEGRRFEAREFILNLIRLNDAQPRELLSLVELNSPFMLVALNEVVSDPSNSLMELGAARHLFVAEADAEAALNIVNRLATTLSHPALDAFRGRLIAEVGDDAAFEQWLNNVAAGTEQHPEYWAAIGTRLVGLGRDREAVRAFGEALQIDSTDRASLRSLAAALERIGDATSAAGVRENLAILDQLFRVASSADGTQAMWIGEQLQKLVRPWESLGWYQHAFRLQGSDPQSNPQLNERRDQIDAWEKKTGSAFVRESRVDRLVGFDIRQYPLPELDGLGNALPPMVPQTDSGGKLAFRDVARELGLDVDFVSEYPTEEVDFYLYQANGGGLAALDYDLDGLCDLYVVQTGGSPQSVDSSEPNQFFRQLPEGIYTGVGIAAEVADRRYGQGVCVGDMNQDGFPDLIVANIGRNSVYLNQGDGTFREDSEAVHSRDSRWTSSIALADMDGDNLPDIIEVNYLNDPQIFEQKCQGKRLSCTPQRFRAASDRIFENLGDGTFAVSDSETKALDARPNYGFGLIVTKFGRSGGNEVFVSNDGDLNHFWQSVPDESVGDAAWKLVESAGFSGCSIGVSGRSQACMGIAASDFDRNGWIDLGVTNFHNEPMNLFLQNQSGFFSDDALRFGLAESSKDVLGFGVQATDYNNDGWSDLAVLNGHIYDARYADIPFRMKPQLFRGGAAGFTLQPSDSLSAYWQRPQLGRTLATLDWNRDGKMDMVSNHLDYPVALLQNESETGNWLQLELVGTVSERDAIGARVVVEAGDQVWTGWQIAGDGYMCTNESIIHIGLGDQTTIDKVTIHWPSNDPQVFENVSGRHRYLAVQGQTILTQR
jgi:tetratricopeptide (TPR) repeat protein